MNPLRPAYLRLRAIVARPRLENEMQSEMREHLERATERFMARGMSAHDARLAARAEFGNVTVHQEDARDARGARWVDALRDDARFALRYFRRHKGMVSIIVTVLMLSTASNALIFSNFQAMFLRPAPGVPDDAGQVRIWSLERATRTGTFAERGFSQPELRALDAHREVFGEVAAWRSDEVILGGADSTSPRGVQAQFITPNFFRALRVPLAAGQGFAPEDGSSDLSAVLSYQLAEQLYGNATSAVGRRVMVNELPVHVVGVAPPRFQGALKNMDEPSLWLPLGARAEIARVSPRWLIDEPSLSLFGRLSAGASRQQATALARQVVLGALPDSAERVGMSRTAEVVAIKDPAPGNQGNDQIVAMTAVAGVGILILLVAWMNVSSLMVAAAVSRRHEIAVRLSLGASRARLLRQLVTESTILAMVGGALGITLSWLALTYVSRTAVDGIDMIPDLGTLVFVLGLSLVSGVLFGLSPALHATRDGVATALRDSGTASTTKSRLQRIFVGAQIALSQPLLVLLGVMLSMIMADYKPLAETMSRRVMTIGFHPLENTGSPRQRREAVEQLVPRLAERPEVEAVTPVATAFAIRGILAVDGPKRNPAADTVPNIVHMEGVAPGWFRMLEIPIILGRDVSMADTAAAERPVVIGTDLARALWGTANPIGRTLASPPLRGLPQDSMAMTVVGVYDSDHRMPQMTWGASTARTNSVMRVFTAHGKQWRREALLVRTRGPAAPLLPDMQRFIREAVPALPVTSMLTLAQADAQTYRATIQQSLLAGAAGLLALLLTSLGLYGVVSLAVQQRTREIGIRIAVGAEPLRVARMFLASGGRVSGVAMLIGLPLSVVGMRVAMNRGVFIAPQANVYVVGACIAIILLLVASAATWVPARRAAHVDPATTLRVE